MIYIRGFRGDQCREYAKWLKLKPTEWRYVSSAMQLRGVRGALFIELNGMYMQQEGWEIKQYILERGFIHVRVKY